MATKTRSKRTRYEWKWLDEQESEPRIIPESWAKEGEQETPSPNEELFYAVEVKTGLVLEYLVDQNGKTLQGPLSERNAIRVLYVSSDGALATVREIISTRKQPSILRVPQSFKSVIAIERSVGEPYEHTNAVKNVIKKFYSEEE